MDSQLQRIEERLRQLEETIARVAARVAALEGARFAPTADRQGAAPVVVPSQGHTAAAALELPILTLVGRTLLVFGGAYLLRALTESGQLTPASGIVVGLMYASAWMGAADRAAVRRPASGLFHGLASLIIACPLVLEASTRFGVLSPATASALLVLLSTFALAVAWHRRLHGLAVMAAVAGSVTTVVLALSTGHVLPFALGALVIGLVAEITGSVGGWRWPSRAPAVVATLLTLDLVARAIAAVPLEPRLPALLTAWLLAFVYVTALVAALLSRRDEPALLDLMLSGAAVMAGVAGCITLARSLGPGATGAVGWTFILAGALGYAVTALRRSAFTEHASLVITTTGALILLVGLWHGLDGVTRTFVLSAVAIALMGVSAATDRPWLAQQGTLFVVSGAIESGVIQIAFDAWTGAPADRGLPSIGLLVTAVAAFGGVALPLIRADHSATGRMTSILLTAIAAAAIGAHWLTLVDAIDARPATAVVIAAERSLVMAALVVALVGLARLPGLASLRWLAYAAIGAGGLKLVMEDLRMSSPLGVFVALGAFGAALIAAARLLRSPDAKGGHSPDESASWK